MTSTIVTTPADDPVIIIERVFDAPRALMFKLFTDPYHLGAILGSARRHQSGLRNGRAAGRRCGGR